MDATFSNWTAAFGTYRTSPAGGMIGYHDFWSIVTFGPITVRMVPLGTFARRTSSGCASPTLPAARVISSSHSTVTSFGVGLSRAGSLMNCACTQLTDPYGAVIASQPLVSSRSTVTAVPRGTVPASALVMRSVGDAHTFASSVTTARYGGCCASARGANRMTASPTSAARRMGGSPKAGTVVPHAYHTG